MRKIDLLVIGTGPAGDTAALYASRAGLSVVIAEKTSPGGRLINTHKIENYPGVGPINGFTLAKQFMDASTSFGAELIYSGVKTVEVKDLLKIVTLEDGQVFEAKAIVVATGTTSRGMHDTPGYEKFLNKGISHCAVCDGAFFRGHKVAVIGGGNSALEESLFSKGIMEKITIMNAFDSWNVEDITMKQVTETENIELRTNTVVKSFNGNEKLESITIVENGVEKTEEYFGAFIYIGNYPNTKFIENLNITDKNGYIVTNIEMETSLPGVYGAGDVNVKSYRQISTAIADGTIAALNAKKFIDKI